MASKKNYKTLELPPKYTPKKSEPYMCEQQLAYFYQMLMAQKEELMHDSDSVLSAVRLAEKTEAAGVGDDSDNATYEQDITMNLRMSERDNNLLRKIDAALDRIENGTYGYSVVSGDEIGLNRMMARPLATMTVEEQEEYEQRRQ
ncbi:MAG: RNA polymerase-binding protein DksA [Pseudomonadota bacterium]|nr:RNA polymerase-binding protein DksA [Pseudomonadota bacterium]HBP26685.1 RNA polymerase-binding protein DksA [Alphaproteobacteria bacterium]HBS76416.1 RNA polymerase-binding protein DksA [Alphaproteobacteria bacterium]